MMMMMSNSRIYWKNSTPSLSLLSIICFLFLSLLSISHGKVTNLQDGAVVEHWMEMNYIELNTYQWTTIDTTKSFIDPVIFLSTVLFSSGRNEFPHPLEPRVKNIHIVNGKAQFQAKLVFPNNSNCLTEWWIPTHYPGSLLVNWLAIEKGGYILEESMQIVVGTGNVSGTVSKIDWQYNFGTGCNYPTQNGDTDYAPNGIFKLQTNRNNLEFISVRTAKWWFKNEISKCSYSWTTGRFFLEPNDGVPYELQQNFHAEKLGYLLYDPKHQEIDCLEGSKIQFGSLDSITDVPVQLYLASEINYATQSIGIFASVLDYNGGDSITPTSFVDMNLDPTIFYLFLQEDQCADEETMHFEELSSFLIVTTSLSSCDSTDPNVIDYTSPPTSIPTASPTTSQQPSRQPTSLVTTLANPTIAKEEDSNLFLAVVLGVIIIGTVAVVAIFSRIFIVKLPED